MKGKKRRILKEYHQGKVYYVLEGHSPPRRQSAFDISGLPLEDQETIYKWRESHPEDILFIGRARLNAFLKSIDTSNRRETSGISIGSKGVKGKYNMVTREGERPRPYKIQTVEFPNLFPISPIYKFCIVRNPSGGLVKIPDHYHSHYLERGFYLLQPSEYHHMAARDKKYEDFRGKLTVAGLELTPDGDLVNPLDGKVIDDIKGYRPFPYFRWRFQLPEEDHMFTGPPQVDRYGYCQVNKPRDFYKRITIRTRRLSSVIRKKILKMTYAHLMSMKKLLNFTQLSSIATIQFMTVHAFLDFMRNRDLSDMGLGPISLNRVRGDDPDDPYDQDSRAQGREFIERFPWRLFPHGYPEDGPELHVHYNTGSQVHMVLCKDDHPTHLAMEHPMDRNEGLPMNEIKTLTWAKNNWLYELGVSEDDVVSHFAVESQRVYTHEHLLRDMTKNAQSI